MLTKKMETALNKQINIEFYSSYLYLSISSYFNGLNLDGFAHWMKLQAQEELMHAIKIYDFVLEREGTVKLDAVKSPPETWKTPVAACEAALKHERMNSKQFIMLMELALEGKDHASANFLQWFVDEQVEEESSATALLEKTKLVADSGGGTYMLDRELASRVLGPE